MEEKTNPCGCGGQSTSRREFIQKALTVGAGVTLAGTAIMSPSEARASGFDYESCIQAVHNAWEQCLVNAQTPTGNSIQARIARIGKRIACDSAHAAAVAACDAQLAGEVAAELAILLAKGALVAGTIIVIAGIVFIVVGGTLVLA